EPAIRTYRGDAQQGRIIDFAHPMVFSQVRVGALYVGFSEKSIDAALARARNQTIAITLGMVLVGVGGAIGLATLLTRPIFRLVRGTRSVGAGHLQVELRAASRGALGARPQ